MGRAITFALMLLVLSACAAARQQEAQQAMNQATETCMASLSSSDLDPIRGKLAFNASQITPELLAVPGTPNEPEKAALQVFFRKRADCNRENEEIADQYGAPFAVELKTAHAGYGTILAKLYQGEITYGTANQMLQQTYLTFLEQSQEKARQEAAQQQQNQMMWLGYMQQQQALQQQQAAQQQQMIQQQQMTKPTTTNCRWLGSTLNCNSY